MKTKTSPSLPLWSAILVLLLTGPFPLAHADDTPRRDMARLESGDLIEADLPWVDESVLASTHGKGYEVRIDRIETEVGVILWDELGEDSKSSHSINLQVRGNGTVQSTRLTIRK